MALWSWRADSAFSSSASPVALPLLRRLAVDAGGGGFARADRVVLNDARLPALEELRIDDAHVFAGVRIADRVVF